jgi:hypothetical protein
MLAAGVATDVAPAPLLSNTDRSQQQKHRSWVQHLPDLFHFVCAPRRPLVLLHRIPELLGCSDRAGGRWGYWG